MLPCFLSYQNTFSASLLLFLQTAFSDCALSCESQGDDAMEDIPLFAAMWYFPSYILFLVLLLRIETQRCTIIQPEACSSLCRETSFSITLSKPQQLFLKDASVSLYISGFSLGPSNFMHSFVLWISTQIVQTSTCKSAIRTSWKMCPELSVEAAKWWKHKLYLDTSCCSSFPLCSCK